MQRIFPLPTGFGTSQWQNMDKDDIADQLDDMAETFYDEQAARMGQQMFEHAQRNGLSMEVIAGATHPLQRAIAQVARERLGDAYGQVAASRLTDGKLSRNSSRLSPTSR